MSRERRAPRSTDSSYSKCSSGTERVLRRCARLERRNPAARCRPSRASRAADSAPSTVKNTLAWDWSRDTSTAVRVIMPGPTGGSRSSRRMISASSRWIGSAMRARRGAVIVGKGPRTRARLRERARDLDHFEDLELVTHLHVVEVLQAQAALEARLHLAHVLL